ncbi:hypothetical protein M5J15_06095 [Serratia symbiotica]|nr:hypothetical protein [Serratia symbiotica]USS96762.1 hypothetical protein M5J15_06095 [Serratia symbiotica]
MSAGYAGCGFCSGGGDNGNDRYYRLRDVEPPERGMPKF